MKIRNLLRVTAWIVLASVALLGLAWAALQSTPVRTWLAAEIGAAASSAGTVVAVEGLEGWLPGAPRVKRVRVADASGAWLVLDDVTIEWNPVALLWGDIVIDAIAVGEVHWLRKPAAEAPPSTPTGFRLPDLRLSLPSVRVAALQLPVVRIDAAVAGAPAVLALGGRLDMLSLQHRAVLGLSVRQAGGGAGRVAIDIDWNRDRNTFRLAASAADRAGGILARLAGLPEDASLSLSLGSRGEIDDWTASLHAQAGTFAKADGDASIRREGDWHRMRAHMGVELSAGSQTDWRSEVAGRWTLALDAALNTSGALRLSLLEIESPKGRLEARLDGDKPAAPLRVTGRLEAAAATGPVAINLSATPDRPWSAADPVLAIDADAGIAGAQATFRGTATAGELDGAIGLALPDLKAFGLESGRVELAGRIEASLDTTSLALEGRGRFSDLRLGDARIDRLLGSSGDIDGAIRLGQDGVLESIRFGVKGAAIVLQASVAGTLKSQRIAASGQLAGKPFALKASLQPGDDGRLDISQAELSVGAVSLAGDLAIGVRGLVEGRLRIEARELADISRLVDADLKGAARGTLALEARGRQQQAQLDLVAPDLRIGTTRVTGAQIDGRVVDLFGKQALDVKVRATRVDAGGFELSDLDLTGRGPLAALEVEARGQHQGGDLAMRARLKLDDAPIVMSIAALSVVRGERELHLAAPTTVKLMQGGADIAPARFVAGSGSLLVGGKVGRDTTLVLEPASLPLWAVSLFAGPLPLEGQLTGRVAFSKDIAESRTTFDLGLTNVSAEGGREVLRNADLRAQGSTDRAAVTFTASIKGSRGATLGLSGRVPFDPEASMAVEARGNLDLAMANTWLSATGERASGRMDLTAKVTGPMSAPRIVGQGTLRNGFFRSAEAGLELRDIEARFDAVDRRIVLSSLTARAPNDGTLEAKGEISVDPDAGYPVSLGVRARGAQLVATSLTSLVSDLDVRLSGALGGEAKLEGTVGVARWEIRVPERLSRALIPIQVRHVNTPPGWSSGEVLPDEGPASAFRFALDLAVRAPGQVFVRGQGIDAEFGGEVRVGGTLDDPSVRGAFDLRRGAIAILSQRVTLSRGNVQFLGDTVPLLDIAGGVAKNGITATVSARGRADDPKIVLSSVPTLPQEEILARLLFSKQATQLTPFEAAQLLQVVGKWSGLDTGPDILERVRTTLGIDALSATTDDKGNTTVTAGRYVGSGVFVGVSQAGGGTATVEIDLTDEIKLRGEAGATDSKVSVAAEWEY